ncbi:MAG: hypothetical protein AAB790_02890 [Patescibacteria group bacterium]
MKYHDRLPHSSVIDEIRILNDRNDPDIFNVGISRNIRKFL